MPLQAPLATYRLQFHAGFTFDDAAYVMDYLAALGISHIYASPYLQAAPRSTHGYDVVDHSLVNHELGGSQGHERFCKALLKNSMGQIIDVVPNHMAISHPFQNKWWWDVLANGLKSRYKDYFDIDWAPPEKRLGARVMLPILEDHYGRVLEEGNIRITVSNEEMASNGETVLDCNGMLLPLSPESRAFMDNGKNAHAIDSNDADLLDEILQLQHYRPTYWRAAAQDLNYRRFFAINDLAALQIDNETVFNETHRLIIDWLRNGVIDGVRIDHPDGMRDPEQYINRLREAAPDAWIVLEKILHPGEKLPDAWQVAGTTGYDFINLAGGLFIDPDGEKPLTRFYTEFTGEKTSYEDLVRYCKHQVMDELLGSDVNRITEIMVMVCEHHRRFRDYTRQELRLALKEILACMPVYRTYVRETGILENTDRQIIKETITRAKALRADIDPALFDFIGELLCRRHKGKLELDFMLRFQQLSGPVTAKGVEDTAFYRYNRFASLNEVGGDPSLFGISLGEFHETMTKRANKSPSAMLATSTHDTKRSEDVRARLALLSEIPLIWASTVRTWSIRNSAHRQKSMPESSAYPDPNMEYFLYQTLVGAWPIETDRAAAFMEKAAREAKQHTSWERPNTKYEAALRNFTADILKDNAFVNEIESFVKPLILPGRINSLSQTLIKLTSPGVPDIYQGTELWDLSLVDPDNRRPVDYTLRRRLLETLNDMDPEQIMAQMEQGLPKMHLIKQALLLRKNRPELFAPSAGYSPLIAQGEQQKHAVAYLRGEKVAVIVPRLLLGFSGEWRNTRIHLPEGIWQNQFTGVEFSDPKVLIDRILDRFPVALLVRE